MLSTRSALTRAAKRSASGSNESGNPTPLKKKKMTTPKIDTSSPRAKSAKKTSPPGTPSTSKAKILLATPKPTTEPLLSLEELIPVTLLHRPSKRNKSPYVADVLVHQDDGTEREAICHVPNLDMGGKCVPGATMLVKPARDNKGNLVGPNAVNPKYGTPKCEFHAQLLKVDETHLGYEPACWVGAHPSLGEKLAEQLLLRNCLPLPEIKSIQREVRNIAGTDMRADFVIQFVDPKEPACVLEVKTVVDTDFAKGRTPSDRTKCVFVSDQEVYRRAGIFPWGQSNQKGPNGEPVVSARAIKHVRELTEIAKGKRKGPDGQVYQAAVLFVVIRKDSAYFRANHEACPSFYKYLKEAQNAGVKILAKRVEWGDTPETEGQCVEGPILDVEWPLDRV